jgi:hypothetical protein
MFRSISRLSVPRGLPKVFFFHPLSRNSHKNNMRGLTVDALNPAILNVQYAVRGELAIKAEDYRVQLKTNAAHDLPFNNVISSNIGNPQQTGLNQPPITFNRQVRDSLVIGLSVTPDHDTPDPFSVSARHGWSQTPFYSFGDPWNR